MAQQDLDGVHDYLPAKEESLVFSQIEAQQEYVYRIAWILANVARGLFLFFLVVIGPQLLPIRFRDPVWILALADSLTRFMFLPLVGLLLLRIGAGLAFPYQRMNAKSRFHSRLALFAAIGYLLLVPLIGFANWRMVRMIQLGQELQAKRVDTNSQLLSRAIDAATSSRDLQLRFQAIGAPPLPEPLINQPLVIVKKQAKDFIAQASNATKFRATTPNSREVVRIYWQSIQVGVLALLSAFCFFCTSW